MKMASAIQRCEYRFSGHETFPCRYAWLPKAAEAIADAPLLFADEDQAMVTLGVGKNMVRSIRFWAEAARIIEPADKSGYRVSVLGKALMRGSGRKAPLDPYMEDVQTLWLIHWNLAVNRQCQIFAWDFFLNKWQDPELSASSAFRVMRKMNPANDKPVSDSVLGQQYDVFLHSYVPTRGRKGEVREDNLDCPLVELELLRQIGVRQSAANTGRHEPVYAFRREPKPEISSALFGYCLDDFWRLWHAEESTLSFNLIANGHHGPGQVFKLPEDDIRNRCESLEDETNGFFEFRESAMQPVIVRKQSAPESFPLSRVYMEAEAYE